MSDSPSSPISCPKCGAVLPSEATAGLCPRCLMGEAMSATQADAEPAAAQKTLAPEELAPHFPQLEILECLGRGGMGVVYKARQKSLNRLVALKLLAPERADDPQFATRFEKEAHALAALNHPHIVGVYDFGHIAAVSSTQLPLYFLLMEFVDGVNLRQAMKAGRFTPEQALAIVPPVCEALQYAHEHGIVHRDIKPENLLLDKEGRVKIADFGIAKMLGTGADISADGGEAQSGTLASVAGTPQYMSPEQKAHGVTDHRADIYSLGVVLYELLTGELPADKLQPPSRKVQVDVRLDEIVLRALEKSPELRYQTAGEFRTQVETMVASPSDANPSQAAAPVPDASVSVAPRFSRTAIVGACWAPLFLITFVLTFWLTNSSGEDHGPTWWQYLLRFTVLPLGLTAPFGTTLLGWISVTQIRRSAGKLYGLWLAVFDGLLFPLLALDVVIGEIWPLIIKALMGRSFDTSAYLRMWNPDLAPAIVREWATVATVMTALIVDFLIIRAVWRAVNNSPTRSATEAPVAPPDAKPSLKPTIILHAVLFALVGLILLLGVPRYSQLLLGLRSDGFPVEAPLATRLVIEIGRIWALPLFPLLLGVDVGLCFLVRKFAGRIGLRWWSGTVVVGLVGMVALSAVALWLPMTKFVERISPADQASTFGPVIEQTIALGNTGNSFYSINRGGFVPGPTEFTPLPEPDDTSDAARSIETKLSKWMTEHDVDFIVRRYHGAIGLTLADMLSFPVAAADFETRSANGLLRDPAFHELASKQLRPAFALDMTGDIRGGKKTMAFQTRYERTGMVQVVGVSNDPPSVTIRYKLVLGSNEKSAAVAKPPQLSFGPVVERVVNGAMDFDSGKVVPFDSIPESVTKSDDIAEGVLKAFAWMEHEGMDAIPEPSTLKGVGLKAKSVDNDAWDKLTPEQVIATLEKTKREPWQNLDPRHGDEPRKTPATWIVETREGGKGILQVLEETEKGVKVRYKLVLTDPADMAQSPKLKLEHELRLLIEKELSAIADGASPERNEFIDYRGLSVDASPDRRMAKIEIDQPKPRSNSRHKDLWKGLSKGEFTASNEGNGIWIVSGLNALGALQFIVQLPDGAAATAPSAAPKTLDTKTVLDLFDAMGRAERTFGGFIERKDATGAMAWFDQTMKPQADQLAALLAGTELEQRTQAAVARMSVLRAALEKQDWNAVAALFAGNPDRTYEADLRRLVGAKSTSAANDAKLDFGPVMEAVLPSSAPCIEYPLQFRSGRLFLRGSGTGDENFAKAGKIIEEAGGVDVQASVSDEAGQLEGEGCVFLQKFSNPSDKPAWDDATPADVSSYLQHQTLTGELKIRSRKDLPITAFFKTARGEIGIMQLLDIVKDERGYHGTEGSEGHALKLCYKLVQSSASSPKTEIEDRRKESSPPQATASAPKIADNATLAPDLERIRERGLSLVSLLFDHKYASAVAEFDERLRAAMPEARLAAFWEKDFLSANADGNFKGADYGAARAVKEAPGYRCIVPFRWETKTVNGAKETTANLEIHFNDSGEVSRINATSAPPQRTLSFGPVVNGLQAALELRAADGSDYALGQPIEVRFHIRNASKDHVHIADESWRQVNARDVTIKDANGQKLEVAGNFYTGIARIQRVYLQPGESTIFHSGALEFLPEKADAAEAKHPVVNYVNAKPGRYTVSYHLRFPQVVEVPENTYDWKGELDTAPVTIEVKQSDPTNAVPNTADVPRASVLQFRWVANAPGEQTEELTLQDGGGFAQKLQVEKAVLLDGSAVQSAEAAADEGTPDRWSITVTLTKDGAQRFAKITGEGKGRRLAIVVNGKLTSAPIVTAPIAGGSVSITGNFTEQQARDLAEKIRASQGPSRTSPGNLPP